MFSTPSVIPLFCLPWATHLPSDSCPTTSLKPQSNPPVLQFSIPMPLSFPANSQAVTSTRRFRPGIHELFENVQSTLASGITRLQHCDHCHNQFQHSQHMLNHITEGTKTCGTSICTNCFGQWLETNNNTCRSCGDPISVPEQVKIEDAIALIYSYHILNRLEFHKARNHAFNIPFIISTFWHMAPGVPYLDDGRYAAMASLENSQLIALMATFSDRARLVVSRAAGLKPTAEDLARTQDETFRHVQRAFYDVNARMTLEDARSKLKVQMIIPQAVASAFAKNRLHDVFKEAFGFSLAVANQQEMHPDAVTKFKEAFGQCERRFLEHH